MRIAVQFFSYFKDLTGCERTEMEVDAGDTLGALHAGLMERYPRLGEMRNSTLLAVGVEYQSKDYVLQSGDLVSLFPPVQGG